MKSTISRQKLMAAAAMLAVVFALSLGIFASNRLLSSWLVGDALEGSLRNWTESDLRLDTRQGREPEDLSSAILRLRSFSQSFVPQIAGVDNGSLHIFELTRFADAVTADLGSSAMRAHARVPLQDETGSILPKEMPEAIIEAGVGSSAIRHALVLAQTSGEPRVTVFYTWWGQPGMRRLSRFRLQMEVLSLPQIFWCLILPPWFPGRTGLCFWQLCCLRFSR
ncbi:hypothetical protein [Pannonibacter phragmitetus]|uniref:hypothetical protein n=1 Tax=Pannonibacter phragmitetus TaxID=121719 RepID=UPI003D2F2DAA